MSKVVLAAVVGTVLALWASPVLAFLILNENFNNVTSLSSASTMLSVNTVTSQVPDPFTTSPSVAGGNPTPSVSGTNSALCSASPTCINVRRTDNAINTNGVGAGFNTFFTPTSQTPENAFLVLGSNTTSTTSTALNPTNIASQISFPTTSFTLGATGGLTINFDLAFGGTSGAGSNQSTLQVELVGASNETYWLTPSPGFSTTATNFYNSGTHGNNNTFLDDTHFTLNLNHAQLVALLNGGSSLTFLVNVDETSNHGNVAAGIDNISLDVPAPSSLLTLGVGLASLTGFTWARRRRARQRPS